MATYGSSIERMNAGIASSDSSDMAGNYAVRIELVGDREATLFLRMTLPLPEGPPEARGGLGAPSQPHPLEQIRALLPEALSELLYPRTRPADHSEGRPAEPSRCRHEAE